MNTLFHVLTQRATWNLGEHIQAAEIYLRLALKAQAQCARTIEVLREMKNPRPVVINQANVAAQQIVQNGVMNVDGRAQSETVGGHQTLAALEPINRAAHPERWRRKTRSWTEPDHVWLNPPQKGAKAA